MAAELLQYVHYHPLRSLAEGGLLVGLLVSLWQKTLPLVMKLVMVCLFDVHWVEWPVSEHLLRLLHREGRLYPMGDSRIRAEYMSLRHEPERHRWVVFKALEASHVLCVWRGRPLFVYSHTAHTRDRNDSSTWKNFSACYSLKWTVDWKKLLTAAATAADADQDAKDDPRLDSPVRRYRVKQYSGDNTPLSSNSRPKAGAVDESDTKRNDDFLRTASEVVNYRREDLQIPPAVNPEADLAMTPPMQEILREARFWHTHRDWYEERGLPWKHGYLLYGPPGTGKTSLVRAVAQSLDVEVHIFSLATMSSYGFSESWKDSKETFARVVVFEDFDTVFEGRKNVTAKSDLTLDVVLNAIDGVEAASGCLLFVTTNRVEAVDPALGAPVSGESEESTRPGRIDRAVYVGVLDYAGRYKIALRVTRDEEMAASIASSSEGCSGAQVQERATKAALKQLWGSAS